MCLAGSGFVLVGDVTHAFAAGQAVTWPAGVMHQLWTEDTTMTTLMLEKLWTKTADRSG